MSHPYEPPTWCDLALEAEFPDVVKATAWQPIYSAPLNREIMVYAPAAHGLRSMQSRCRWHLDAGFCVDELREPTLWRELTVDEMAVSDGG